MKPRISLDPPRGFRDLLAPESEQLTYLFHKFEEVVSLHGYREVKPPTLEKFEVFAVKSGEEIRRTMYVFKDKAGREVALRPEATASIARIYLKHLRHIPKPIRLYYIINCFRYEEPQYARYREFWQAGIELLGEPSILGDIEVVKILVKYYEEIGFIRHVRIKIGTTKFYRKLFAKYKINEEEQDLILHYMDKNDYERALSIVSKHSKELVSILKPLWKENRYSIREAKTYISPIDEKLAQTLDELELLSKILAEYNNNVNIEVDLAFARGLAYYTGIIFEVIVPDFPVSIAGGGRYDTLIELYGGEKIPGTGFAIGVDRTLLAMKEKGLEPPSAENTVKTAILVLSNNPKAYYLSLKIGDRLAENNIVATLLKPSKISKILPKLAEQGYRYVIFLGERELQNDKLTVKDLQRQEQYSVDINELQEVLQRTLKV